MLRKLRRETWAQSVKKNPHYLRDLIVGGGSCGDYTEAAVNDECDAFVTADIKYAKMLYAHEADITLIDAGHFCTEDVVCPEIISTLSKAFPTVSFAKSKRHGEMIRFLK